MLLATLLGTVLTPLLIWCAMLVYNQLDPACEGGGEDRIGCAMRALAVTGLSIVPGLLIGVIGGLVVSARRAGHSAK